ncbi:type 2 lanthipeptide synthetase LanM [Halorussus sp. MSC15.2]|uniref:type 2 lanthipeptide synthetase LanM n=1 Tax=Halorussus sp. MSC15.2 TaxID=2283638 RepID=UPI0013D5AE89|nr:type 2 lanthipeptide synthetase LanM [Halorussus sp. MSC15.2]NEU58713.1 type 2 lantipeptide synthetase LanM [Halorussus sp. MSC15.2]
MNPDYYHIAATGELLHDRVQNGHASQRETAPTDSDKQSSPFDDIDSNQVDILWKESKLDSDNIDSYVQFDRWPDDEDLPQWITEFTGIVETLSTVDTTQTTPYDGKDVPFEHILWPIVKESRSRLTAEMSLKRVSEDGLQDFEWLLLDQLAEVAAQALHIDYISYIYETDSEVLENDQLSSESTEWYDAYVTAFFEKRAASFFEEFPMAAKLITIVSRQWRAMVTQFLSRLNDDIQELNRVVNIGDGEQVVGISGKGDLHSGGSQVLLVEFNTGNEVVYKPRSIDPENRLYDFETWVYETFDDVPELRTPATLVRPDYGWIEKVEQADHSEIETIEQYYRGAGALLCVLYVLNVTDCHFENLIATDNSPVLVDPETILEMNSTPVDKPQRKMNEKLRRHIMNNSVIGIGALPHDAIPDDTSGIAGIDGREARNQHISWKDVNTDAIDIEYHTPVGSREKNFPTLSGKPAPPSQFVDEIADGFEATYDAIKGASDRVTDLVSDQFDSLQTRVLLRNSRVYSLVLKALTTPKYLRSGALYSYKIREVLSTRPDSPVVRRETKMPELSPTLWDEIIKAEREALHRGDIPKFTVYSDDPGLYFDDEKILSALTEKTGVERFMDRIEDLCERDKRQQVGLIRACLSELNGERKPHPEGKI